jgi:HPt (histidine-containing phosphotransfer) domain-containing protein
MNDPLAPLRAKFIERCRSDLAVLRRGAGDGEMRHAVHRLAGAGGVFGFPEISDLARRLDDQAQTGEAFDSTDLHALVTALEAVSA